MYNLPVMDALWLLLTCLLLGVATARLARPPESLADSLNWWVINISLPALILVLVPQIEMQASLWFLVASQWLVFLGGWVLFASLGRLRGWSRGRIGALVLVCGLGNTSFMGYPLIHALRGDEGLALAVIADQVGCFIALAVGGAIVAATYSGATLHPAEIGKRLILFPPFIALLLALLVGAAGGWPAAPESVLRAIGSTLTPLALFSVGLRLRPWFPRDQLEPLSVGLAWKLLLAPLAVLALGYFGGVSGLTLKIGVLEAAMAPMISATILATRHGLAPRLANAVLGLGLLLSLPSVLLWNAALG